MSDSLVQRADHGRVRVLTLNRPQALNSFTRAMHGELLPALDAAALDDSVRCVVITGAGRGFCAGQDLNDALADVDVGDLVEQLYKPLALRVRSMPVPVLAVVNGVAAGAGANFALGCDIVIAALAATRRVIDDSMALDYAAALSHEATVQRRMGAAHDAKEGIAAFLAKRAPTFTDR
jgi:2-(1,2-epoxy-1,2-dihydrophenyl)acetyl-CoA isomerase